MQIVQFVFGIGCGSFVCGNLTLAWLFPGQKFPGCPGCSWFASFFGLGVLASYLILFLLFYRRTYKKVPQKDD